MTDRAEGYVLELGYRHAYHAELAPGLLRFAALSLGIAPPAGDRSLRYLELAFGQGLSLNIHAAAQPGDYTGFDLNPAHAANARELAGASGARVRILEDSFENYLAREDEGRFDIIAMHGTWSWISAANRHRVVEIVRRSLAPGGLFYMSYNTWPGWALELPLRHLLTQHAQRAPQDRPLAERIDAALDFAQSLKSSGAKFFKTYPQAADALEAIRKRDRHYVAHEYFNRDWHPMPFAEVCDTLSAAGLEFAGPVQVADDAALKEDSSAMLEGVLDPVLRQTVLDYQANRTFRRDLFIKGARRLDDLGRETLLRKERIVLVQHPDYVPIDVLPGLCSDSAARIVRALADAGYSPIRCDELSRHPACADLPFHALLQGLMALIGEGSVQPAMPQAAIERAKPACTALNRHLLAKATHSGEVAALACPVTGAGLFAVRLEMLFLRAIADSKQSPSEWAAYAKGPLGAACSENFATKAEAFARIRLPVLQALGVA